MMEDQGHIEGVKKKSEMSRIKLEYYEKTVFPPPLQSQVHPGLCGSNYDFIILP